MAEIGSIPPNSNWQTHRVVNTSNDANQSGKKQQHKKKHDDEISSNLNHKNTKKKPPDSNINSHIDEYV